MIKCIKIMCEPKKDSSLFFSFSAYKILVIIPLFLSLFIYLFYRSDYTVVNELSTLLFPESYILLKHYLSRVLPLPYAVVYHFPEACWVFSTTIALYGMKIKGISLTYFPLVFSFGLEIFQLSGITNGTFDSIDILFVAVAWLVAKVLSYIFKLQPPIGLKWQLPFAFIFFFIIYLSDIVIK